jgi:hypothetical protein
MVGGRQRRRAQRLTERRRAERTVVVLALVARIEVLVARATLGVAPEAVARVLALGLGAVGSA